MTDPELLELSAKAEAKLRGRSTYPFQDWDGLTKWIIAHAPGTESTRALNPYDGNDLWEIVKLAGIKESSEGAARAAWFKLAEEIVK